MDVVEELKARVTLPPDVASELSSALVAARARWPQGREPDAAFVELVAARLPQPRVEELYLAWWCGSGDEAAIEAFERAYADDLRVLSNRFRDVPADELRQLLRIKLFVGDDPAIRDYRGTGSLKSWLRVTAVRYFIDVTRSAKSQRVEQLDEQELLGIADPRGSQIRAELAGAVKAAFAQAVANLLPRQRVFLRHAYVDRHTLDQIASHYAVHRTTVARTLAAAREQLIAQTRANVVGLAGIDEDELTSVIRMLDSRIDLSLSRVLDTK